jgi:hypothetical protein
MSDVEAGLDGEVETIEKRHKKELKELSAKIQGLKKSVTKGDAKKKKAVLAEIEQLQQDMTAKHAKELQEQAKMAPPAVRRLIYFHAKFRWKNQQHRQKQSKKTQHHNRNRRSQHVHRSDA